MNSVSIFQECLLLILIMQIATSEYHFDGYTLSFSEAGSGYRYYRGDNFSKSRRPILFKT